MKAPTQARHSNFLVALAVCIFAYWHTSTFAYSAEVEVGNLGISGDGAMTSSKFGGVRDNLHLYLDVAGYTDVITLLIGINDMGWDGKSVDVTYVAWTNMVHEMSVQRPAAKIIASTVLECRDQYIEKVKAFNSRLRADYEAHNLPGNLVLLDLCNLVPLSVEGNFFYDDLHPNWKGDAAIAKCFAGKIMETLPLPAFTGTADPTVTDVAQTALGAINTVPPAYRSGMRHVFTIDAAGAANRFYGSAPYTATNTLMALDRSIVKAGYYMELVRAGTNRRRYVWVDFDVNGKTLDQVDWPWNGGKFHQVVTNLHVYSNDSGIKNIPASASGCKGVVEATSANYSNKDGQIAGLPRDMIGGNKFGWNDSLNDSGSGYGCFQVHRIFSRKGEDTHWNNAQVLLAWNRWGGNVSGTDEIGIGDYACHASGVGPTMDYTLTVNNGKEGLPDTVGASAYQVRHLEIWVEPEPLKAASAAPFENVVRGTSAGDVKIYCKDVAGWKFDVKNSSTDGVDEKAEYPKAKVMLLGCACNITKIFVT